MLEYQDGHVDEPEPLEDAVSKLRERLTEVKALHVGTEADLTRQRRRMLEREVVTLEDRMERLEAQVEALTPATSDIVHVPTADEVARFKGDE